MKKFLSLVLALVLCLSVAGIVMPASAEEEPYELVILRYGSNDQPGDEAVVGEINKWLSENGYNFTISTQLTTWGDPNLQIRLAAKEHIDISWTNYAGTYSTMIDGNFFYNLIDIYKDYEGLYNSMPEYIWNSVLRDGGKSLYQIPCYKEAGSADALVVLKSVADRFGWSDIIANDASRVWTLQELEPYMAEAYATGDYEQMIFMCGVLFSNGTNEYIGIDDYAAITSYIAIDLSGDTAKAVKITDIPAYQDLVKTMVKYNEAGYITEGQLTGTASRDQTWVFNVDVYTPDFQNNMDNRYATYDENGVYYMRLSESYRLNNSALGSAYSVISYTENVEACMQFMDALYSNTELADLWLYGIEGVNYTRLEDGSCQKIADSGYSYDTWCSSNVMTVSLQDTDSKDKKEQYAAFNDNAVDSILLGFDFDDSAVKAECAACDAVFTEYGKALNYGFLGEEGLDDFADALEGAGVQKVLDEVNAQLAEFFAAK